MTVPDVQHRATIEEVLVRYAHALDDREFYRLRAVFTADAKFGTNPEIAGVEAIIAHIEGLLRWCGPSQHLLGSISIDIDGDFATSRCAVRALHLGAGDRRDLVYELLGEYHDKLRCAGDQWRIAHRVLVPRVRTGPRDLVLGLDREP